MKIRKSLAGIAAGSLALAGIAVVSAPAANAAGFAAGSPGDVVPCHLYFASGLPGTPAGDASLQASNSTFEVAGLDLSNYTPNAGDTVTVTLTTGNIAAGPAAIATGSLNVTATIALSGAQSGTVALSTTNLGGSGAFPASDVLANGNLGAATLTGTFVASGNGALTAAFQQFYLDDTSSANADNYCDGIAAGNTAISTSTLTANGQTTQTTNYSAGPPVVGFKATRFAPGSFGWDVPPTWDPKVAPTASATIRATATTTGPNASVTAISGQAVTTAARAGNVITVAGTVWTPSTAITSVTVGGVAAANTLVVSGGGALSGDITVPAAAALNSQQIVITQGSNTSSTPIYILGTPTLTISPASGGPGQTITASGSNWNPNSVVAITTCSGAIGPCSIGTPFNNGLTTVNSSAANSTGAFAGATIGAAAGMAFVQASQGAGASAIADFKAFTLSADTCNTPSAPGPGGVWGDGNDIPSAPGCDTKQSVTATVQAGLLKQTAYAYNGGWNTSPGAGQGGTVAGQPAFPPVTYWNLATTTSGTGTGLTAGVVRTGGSVVAVFVQKPGTGYVAGDTFTIAAGLTGAGSTAITITLTSANGYTSTLVPFGAVTSSVAGSTVNRNLNPITVEDARGSLLGWDLSAVVTTPLTAVDGTVIAASNLAVTAGSCSPSIAGSATAVTNGPAGALNTAVSLCSKVAANTTGSSGSTTSGQYVVAKGLTLTVPAFQKAGSYTGEITVTLV